MVLPVLATPNSLAIEISRYTSDHKLLWDTFVVNTKNNHFFFQRDYMDYHQDRFIDHSLMFFNDGNLLAILPATQHDNTLISHGGLTFGGFLVDAKMKASLMLDVFITLNTYLKSMRFKSLRYKAIPHIYHELSAEEDLYALFIHDARLVRRDISSTINLKNKLGFSGGKKNGITKAKKQNLVLHESVDYDNFFKILNAVLLDKHKTSATHTAEEMILLADKFPDHIKLHAAFLNDDMIAGVIMYLTNTVAHTQYMATTDIGRQTGALDFLLDHLINAVYTDKNYFDFGISTEQQGRYLNQGLISQKELFGARSVVYDSYEIVLES